MTTPGHTAAPVQFRRPGSVLGSRGGQILASAEAVVLYSVVGIPTEHNGMKEKNEVWQGTMAIMVLKALDVLGPQHGYGIARRIDQISGNLLSVNHGTLYPILLKLEQEGSITSEARVNS